MYLMIHDFELLLSIFDLGRLLLNFLEPLLSDLVYPLPLHSHLLIQLSPPPHHFVQLAPYLRLFFSQLLQSLIQVLLLSEYLTWSSLSECGDILDRAASCLSFPYIIFISE
jgi:hypothetical protein